MFHKQECVLFCFCFYTNCCSAENTDTALFSGIFPSVASDRSYHLRIIIVCDINRPKWLVYIQNAGNEKFRTNIEIAKMNGNDFLCVRDLKVCVSTIFTSKSYIYIIVLIAFIKCLSVCLSVRPPVRMEQLASHWTDFHEI